MQELALRLQQFASEQEVNSKGRLALILFLTRAAAGKGSPPFSKEDFRAKGGGQVAGLSKAAVQEILAKHKINRVLAEEGGRTSRGSNRKMETYVDFLNSLANDGLLDFNFIEEWWVKRIQEHFSASPFKIKVDASKSLRSIISELLSAVFIQQQKHSGTMIGGAVMQHLVGAKLEIALPRERIEHNSFSTADAPTARKGDFQIGSTVIHVTAAPSEALIRKCCDNLDGNLRPLIVTLKDKINVAYSLADNNGVADRIEILEIKQFIATNVLERSKFRTELRKEELRKLIDVYNRIVEEHETDPGMKIKIS